MGMIILMLFTDDDLTEPVDGADGTFDPSMMVNRRLLPGTTIVQTDYHDGSRDFHDAGRAGLSTMSPLSTSSTYSNLINIPETIDMHDAEAGGQPASMMFASTTKTAGTPASTWPVKRMDSSSMLPKPAAIPGLSNVPAGAKPAVSTVMQPDGYLARMGSQTGRNYAKIVNEYAGRIGINPKSDANDASAGLENCALQIRRSQWDGGNRWSWPKVGRAEMLGDVLTQDPYNRYWQKLGDRSTYPSMSNVPQGAIAVWDKHMKGDANGHVAIVFHKNNRTYLLGSTNGKYVYDVTGDDYWTHHVTYYLPR